MTLPKLKKTKTGDVTDPDLKPKVPFLLKPRYLPALLKTVAAWLTLLFWLYQKLEKMHATSKNTLINFKCDMSISLDVF